MTKRSVKPPKFCEDDFVAPKGVFVTREIIDNFDWSKVVYAEPGGRMGMTDETMVYVLDGDEFILYKTNGYSDSELDSLMRRGIYNNTDKFYCYTARFGNVALVRKDDKLAVNKGGFFVYDNKYRIEASVKGVFQDVARAIEEFDVEYTKEVVKKFGGAGANEISERVEAVRGLCFSVGPRDDIFALKLTLALGAVSKEILAKYLGFNYAESSRFINRLERFGAISKTDDIRTPLVSSVEEYQRRLENREESFCAAVDTFRHGQKTVVYDFRPTEEIRAADEFMGALRDFCGRVNNERINRLFQGKGDTVRASAILQALNGEETPYYYSDGGFDLFHTFVTKFMLSSGWFSDFPAMLLETRGIAMLRLDIVKYILANWGWLEAIYAPEIFRSFAEKYGATSLGESAIEEDAVRRAYIEKYLRLEIAEYEKRIGESVNRFITNKERNPWFEENGVGENITVKNTGMDSALGQGFMNSND